MRWSHKSQKAVPDIKSYSWNSIYFLFVVTGGIGVVIRLFGALWQTALGTSWAIVASIFVVLSYIALWQWAKQHETLQLLGYKYAANLQLQNLKTVDDEIASAGFGYAMKTSFRDRWYAWFRFLAAACALVAIFFKFDAISAFIGGFFGRKQSDKAEDTPSFTNITSCMSRFWMHNRKSVEVKITFSETAYTKNTIRKSPIQPQIIYVFIRIRMPQPVNETDKPQHMFLVKTSDPLLRVFVRGFPFKANVLQRFITRLHHASSMHFLSIEWPVSFTWTVINLCASRCSIEFR